MMKRLIVSLAALMTLSACVSLIPEPDAPDALYRLGPVEATQSIAINRSVLIREPEAPRVLAGHEMATRNEAGVVRLLNGAEWADRMPRMFQMTLLDYLGADGGGFALLPGTGGRADLELSWRISEFALQRGRAIGRAELIILDGKTREPLEKLTIESVQEASELNSAARAEALAEAGRDLIHQAGAFVSEASAARN